ncbi:MAG: response regulator [Acidimicrobiales bacterium]
MSDRTVRPVSILLVEDSPGDVNITREALRQARIANELHVVTNGEAALDYLHQRGEHADAERPDLVLLDLNIPRVSGHEVLEEVKNDPELLAIPIVVLTTSSAQADVLRSYSSHANSFVTKPVTMVEFMDALGSLESFWLQIVTLPGSDED